MKRVFFCCSRAQHEGRRCIKQWTSGTWSAHNVSQMAARALLHMMLTSCMYGSSTTCSITMAKLPWSVLSRFGSFRQNKLAAEASRLGGSMQRSQAMQVHTGLNSLGALAINCSRNSDAYCWQRSSEAPLCDDWKSPERPCVSGDFFYLKLNAGCVLRDS